MAGSATGMFSLIFHYPFDVLRVRMACDMAQYKMPRFYSGILDCAIKMLRAGGI